MTEVAAGGLYTLSLILVVGGYRDDALVRANAHIALLVGAGCLLGRAVHRRCRSVVERPLRCPLLMAAGAALFVWLACGAVGVPGTGGCRAPRAARRCAEQLTTVWPTCRTAHSRSAVMAVA